mmetsp:Transcript_99909/g.172279  ORF Transcript_99909/g.172279 Transcript_99909/m.172279 type:complete len:330 (+) Transcript_99909:3685-4674(+)
MLRMEGRQVAHTYGSVPIPQDVILPHCYLRLLLHMDAKPLAVTDGVASQGRVGLPQHLYARLFAARNVIRLEPPLGAGPEHHAVPLTVLQRVVVDPWVGKVRHQDPPQLALHQQVLMRLALGLIVEHQPILLLIDVVLVHDDVSAGGQHDPLGPILVHLIVRDQALPPHTHQHAPCLAVGDAVLKDVGVGLLANLHPNPFGPLNGVLGGHSSRLVGEGQAGAPAPSQRVSHKPRVGSATHQNVVAAVVGHRVALDQTVAAIVDHNPTPFGVGNVIVAELRVGCIAEEAMVAVAEDAVAIDDAVGIREEHSKTLPIDDSVARDLWGGPVC